MRKKALCYLSVTLNAITMKKALFISLCVLLLAGTGCKKNVEPEPQKVAVTGVAVIPRSVTLKVGETKEIIATITPANADNQNVSWSTSNSSVATVADGLITAVGAGEATITVTTVDGGKTATCAVTVSTDIVPVTGITIDQGATAEVEEGNTITLTATVQPDNATDKTVTWASAHESVATVVDGVVTGIAPGQAIISAKAGDKTATCVVKVKAAVVPVSSVALDKTELTLTVGDPDVKLVATVTPDNATDKTVNWASDKAEVATVDNQGSVHAVAPGEAIITVTTTDGGKTATCTVTVKAALPTDALSGEFSVSGTKKVHFSQGNLVATINASGTPTAWKFAANQYDYIGSATANTSIGSTAGDIDLFGWSTAATKYGISTSTSLSDYSGDFVDWGTAIDDKGTWRTLTTAEWQYLFNGRSNASSLYKNSVTVCGKENCLIIAPDNWDTSAKPLNASYDATAWATAEAAGLVCLPAAGSRSGSDVGDVGRFGTYWSSSAYGSTYACYVSYSYVVYPDFNGYRSYGLSVRLITESK